MKIDREELLAAVKAANEVVVSKHSILLFTKVWLLDGSILAFNNTGTVLQVPIDMSPLGGVDGDILERLLKTSTDDDVIIETTDSGQAKVVSGRSMAKLAVTDPSNYVTEVQNPPTIKRPIELAVGDLLEDVALLAMTKIREIRGDPRPEFGCITIHARTDNLIMYTSDRRVINRTIFKVKGNEIKGEFLVPLPFMQALIKSSLFTGGDLQLGEGSIMAKNDDGAMMYTKLGEVADLLDFKAVVGRLWPEGKIDIALLVDMPDDFGEALTRASAVIEKDAGVHLSVAGNEMNLRSTGRGSTFEETIEFEHPDVSVYITPSLIIPSLPLIDRIFISNQGMALFGPKRFSKFIAGRAGG